MTDKGSLTRSERARRAVLARWGGQRIVRLDQLEPRTRRIVLAVVAASKTPEAEC